MGTLQVFLLVIVAFWLGLCVRKHYIKQKLWVSAGGLILGSSVLLIETWNDVKISLCVEVILLILLIMQDWFLGFLGREKKEKP